MRTWPALELGRLAPASSPAAGSDPGEADRTDLVQAALVDCGVAAIEEISPSYWRVFFHSTAERDAAATALHQQFAGVAISPVDVPDEDWAARSQASLHAVQVGKIVVAPPWDLPDSRAVVIVIQPSMGFGTGHHATTRLCLDALQRLDLTGRTVVDVGTGSGVLAIAASRLGAGHVLAIDDDADAIQSAAENMTLNPLANVTLRVADLRSGDLGRFDVVVANLTGAMLMGAAGQLQAITAAKGRMILSGIMVDEEDALRHTFAGLALDHRLVEDEWLCVTLRA